MATRNTLFHDFAADDFPITVEIIHVETGEVTFSVTVDGPAVVSIPPAAPTHRGKLKSRLTTRNACWESLPDGTERRIR